MAFGQVEQSLYAEQSEGTMGPVGKLTYRVPWISDHCSRTEIKPLVSVHMLKIVCVCVHEFAHTYI